MYHTFKRCVLSDKLCSKPKSSSTPTLAISSSPLTAAIVSTPLLQVGLIGRGTFGIVTKCLDLRYNPPQTVAVKILPRGDFIKSYKSYVKREIVNQAGLHHPLVIQIREVFLTPSNLGIVMEYAQGGDLHSYLQLQPGSRVSEPQARWLFQQIVVAIDFCHASGVAMRDVKLENVLLDSNQTPLPLLKLCDFGYSKHELNSSCKTRVGTLCYMPPEVLLGEAIYDPKKSDTWALGTILFCMLSGRYPFEPNDTKFAQKIVKGEYAFDPAVHISDACKDLVSKLLVPNPTERASVADILKHSWFKTDLPPGCSELNARLIQSGMGPLDSLSNFESGVEELVDLAENVGDTGQIVCRVVAV